MTDDSVRMLHGGSVATERPAALVTVDMDGVLSEPLLGMNITARGPVLPPEGPHAPSRLKGWLWPAESIRYFGRRSMPGAEAFLRDLASHYRLILVTARGRPSALRTRAWLERHRLWSHLEGLVFRTDPHQPSYAYKAEAVGALRPAWHVDDDGQTAMSVRQRAGVPVVLIAWPGNAGVYPDGIVRVPDLAAAATFLNSVRPGGEADPG